MIDWKRGLRDLAKGGRSLAHQGLKVGLVIRPGHHNAPIADLDQLKKSQRLWARRSLAAPAAGGDFPSSIDLEVL